MRKELDYRFLLTALKCVLAPQVNSKEVQDGKKGKKRENNCYFNC